MKMVLVKNVENVEKAANCHGDKVEMVGPFRPMNIFIGTYAECMEILRKGRRCPGTMNRRPRNWSHVVPLTDRPLNA